MIDIWVAAFFAWSPVAHLLRLLSSPTAIKMAERKAVIKNADMSEVRPRRVHRRARFPCFIDARKWNHSAVSSPREVLAKTVPSTVPVRCVDHAFSVKLTARIPPHHCSTTNRTCSRMPWTAPPRCVPRSDPKRSALANLPTLALPNCVFLTTSTSTLAARWWVTDPQINRPIYLAGF